MAKIIAFESGRRIVKPQEYQRGKGGNDNHIKARIVHLFDERHWSIRRIAINVQRGDNWVVNAIRESRFAAPAAERRAA